MIKILLLKKLQNIIAADRSFFILILKQQANAFSTEQKIMCHE